MILLIFEGKKTEPQVMATLQYLFFSNAAECILCSFGTDTLSLWKEVKEHTANGYDADAFTIMRNYLHNKGDYSLDGYYSYQIEAIYLFFDYDPQNHATPETLNGSIEKLLSIFNDAMGNGKIFISYPMIESLFCFNTIPDPDYKQSRVSLALCHKFKDWGDSTYRLFKQRTDLLYRTDKNCRISEADPKARARVLKDRWKELIKISLVKANWICNGSCCSPTADEDISQEKIFSCQLEKFVSTSTEVALLNAFPMFLYEHFLFLSSPS